MHRREFTQAFSGVAVAGLWLPAKLLKMTGQGRRVDERVTAFPAYRQVNHGQGATG